MSQERQARYTIMPPAEQPRARYTIMPPEDSAPLPEGAARTATQPFAGFNAGLDNLVQLASRGGRLVTDRIFEGANALFGTEFDTSAPSVRPVQQTQEAASGQSYQDLPAESMVDRALRRGGEEAAYTLPLMGAAGRAGQAQGAVNAVSNASRGNSLPAALAAPMVQEAARTPAKYAASELALALTGGAGASAAVDAVPQGGVLSEMAGSVAGTLAPTAAAQRTRAVMRGGGQALADAMQSRVDDAARAGTTLTAGQLPGDTADSFTLPGSIEAVSRTLPGGQLVLNRVYQRQADGVGGTLDNLARALTDRNTPEGAGQSIREGVQSIADNFAREADARYSQVDALIDPQSQVRPQATLDAVRDLAADIPGAPNLSRTALGDAQMRSIRDALENDLTKTELRIYDRVVGPSGTIPYEAISGLRSVIGRKLAQPALVSDMPRANLERLYAALSEDIGQAARTAGDDAVSAWASANDFYREGRSAIDNYVQPFVRGARDANPEQAFAELDRAVRRGPTAIREFRTRLLETPNGQQQWDDVVGVSVSRLGRANPGQQGAEGVDFSFNTFLTNWNQLQRNGGLSELFQGTSNPDLLNDLNAIARTAERVRAGAANLSNPSGSGAAALAGSTAIGAGGLALSGDLATAGATMLSSVGASAGVGYLMSRPWFVRWLAQATREPAARIPNLLTRLTMTAYEQGDEQDRAAVQEFVQSMEPYEMQAASAGQP